MKFIKRFIAILSCAMLIFNTMSINTYAKTLERGGLGEDTTGGTWGSLVANTVLNTDVPFITMCYVESVGTSNFYFTSYDTGLELGFINQQITANIGGIGSGSVDMSGSGVDFDSSGNTYTADTLRWNYTINSSIWRLYYYHETHSCNYTLNYGGQALTTITTSTVLKY